MVDRHSAQAISGNWPTTGVRCSEGGYSLVPNWCPTAHRLLTRVVISWHSFHIVSMSIIAD